GGGTPSTKIEDYWDGDINWFTPSEIGNNIYAYSSIRKITKIGLKNSSAKILPKNKTILFTSRAGIGDTAILKNDAATNQGFQSLIVKENVDIYFLYSMAPFIKKEAIRRASGSTFLEISVTEMKKIKLYIPNVYEQKKIGKLIQILDRIITLEQEKLNHILEIKHAFLRKVYSTKANDNMILFKMNKYISKKGKINKENKEYIVSSVNNKKGFINQSEQFESTRLNNLDKSTYRIIDPKDFAYNPSRINVGSIGYNDTDNTLIVSPLYIVFRLNDEINDKYFYYYTQTEKFLYEVNRNTEGSVRQSLTFENMGNINIPIPNNYQIQLLISQYFKKIDNIIFITEQKINRCKKIKTYLLQSLFV